MALAKVEAIAPPVREAPTRIAPPCAFVIFGATGDLTRRKLLPAIFKLVQSGSVTERFAVVGIARSALTREQFVERVQGGLAGDGDPASSGSSNFCGTLEYVSGEFDDPQTYQRLRETLERV